MASIQQERREIGSAIRANEARLRGMRVRNLVQTCGACPSQWDAETEDGQRVYVRYRHWQLRVTVGGYTLFERTLDDTAADGVIAWEEVERRTGLRAVQENET